jgi:glycosyltransferase involved in cell wall biosynthesis
MISPSRIGGAETYFAQTVARLRLLGDEVVAFCPAGRTLLPYLAQQDITPVSWKTTGKIDPVTVWKLVALIRAQRIEVVHTHLSSASFLGSLAARIAHVPCVSTVHGLVEALWYHLPQRVVAVSQAVKAHLVAQGLPAEKIAVVYNGIPVAEYHPLPAREARVMCGLDAQAMRIGVFGRLSSEKGQDLAVRAWPLVLQRFPDARLMVVGDGPQREPLQRLADELAVAARTDFLPFQRDLRPYISACDLVLMPSRREGLGLVALEAMALERPVLAAHTGGLPEAVTDGECGLLSPVNNYQAFADNIITVLEHADLATRLGAAGRRRVLEHFALPKQIDHLRAILQGRY